MAIFDELKSVGKILQEAGKIEQYKQILEVQEKLLEMQKKITDLESENKDLKEKLTTKENLKYRNNAYWIDEKDKKEGPFCSRCWDDEKKLMRMHYLTHSQSYYCCKCRVGISKVE